MLGMHKALKVMIGMLELQLMHIFSKGKNVSKCELVPQKKGKIFMELLFVSFVLC